MRLRAEPVGLERDAGDGDHKLSRLRGRFFSYVLSLAAQSPLTARREARTESIYRTAFFVLAGGVCYYLATKVAWALCFPNSKVSLIFPPHAVLVAVLLLVPSRHWWAYTLAAVCGHFVATRQADWPILYSFHCEAFDAVQNVLTAAGIRFFIKSPIKTLTLRDAVAFVMVAVVVVPFGTAFWGAAFTISNHYGTQYWVEWRNLGISNGVTAIVLLPAILQALRVLSARRPPRQVIEACLLGVGILTVGHLVFDKLPAGPQASPVLLYAAIPLLIWAALRFGLGGMSASMVVTTFQAVWGTMHGHGPFLMQTPAENALALQGFLLVISIPLFLLAVVVEDQKRSEQALRESEGRYREVVESQTNLLCRHLPDSTLTFVNDAYCRFLGRSREELLGRKLLDFIPLHGRESVSRHLASLILGQGGVTQEIEVSLPNGSTVWYQWTVYPVRGSEGQAAEFQSVGHDISDRKRAEEAVRILAHATRVSTVGALAGSLAHELNQPLTAILSNAQAGSRFMTEAAPNLAEIREVLQEIAQDTKRAGEVIRQLRTLVKNEDLRFDELELNPLIRDVVRLLHSDTLIRKVQIVLDLDNARHSVRGDGVQLQQVILNLVLNAFDAMKEVPEGERKVCVRTRPAHSGAVHVEVSDRGTGIHPEKMARLFEPFQSTKPEGLGLGLSISRSIVEAHNGRLWAVNNPDRGATFCFTLPPVSPQPNSK